MKLKRKLTVLLIEDDAFACKELEAYFDTCEDMQLIGCTGHANIGLSLVSAHLPNVILLDLELHRGSGNGFMFLKALQDHPVSNPPYIIVTTQNMSDATLSQVRELGADLILTKYDDFYSPEYVGSTIRLMEAGIARKNTTLMQMPNVTPERAENQLKLRVQRELELIGINPKNKGYAYLTDAIQIYMEDSSIHISRALVQNYKKSEKSIERAMQNAIKRAWDTNDIDILYKYYTAYIRPDKGYPTLMEFICYYSNRIKNNLSNEKFGEKSW